MRKFVFGGSYASAVPLLLDTYPAMAAYSLRKLRTAYTGAAIRVRRSSDNAEQDIGFVGVDLDTASLLTFVGAGNGFITMSYNQGLGRFNPPSFHDSPVTSAAQQPLIVSAGVLQTLNGKPAYRMPTTARTWFKIYDGPTVYPCDIYTTFSVDSAAPQFVLYTGTLGGQSNDGSAQYIGTSGSTNTTIHTSIPSASYVNTALITPSNRGQMYNIFATGVQNLLYTNQITVSSITFSGYPSFEVRGYFQEMIYFEDTNTIADKVAIETNINTYYAIYP